MPAVALVGSPLLVAFVAAPVGAAKQPLEAVERDVEEHQIDDHIGPLPDLFVVAEVHQAQQSDKILIIVDVG